MPRSRTATKKTVKDLQYEYLYEYVADGQAILRRKTSSKKHWPLAIPAADYKALGSPDKVIIKVSG